jgi:hypothetical protein
MTGGRPPESFRGGLADWWPFRDRAWQHTAHAFGFLATGGVGDAPRPIQAIGMVQADPALRGGRVKIAHQLRLADYPGGGTHRVLFDFYAGNQLPGRAEELHFNTTYRVREGERAAIAGYPIFIGLNVGSEGVAFRCHTVNVKNDADEAFLDLLEGVEPVVSDNASSGFSGSSMTMMSAPRPVSTPPTEVASRQPAPWLPTRTSPGAAPRDGWERPRCTGEEAR